jgi:hypothetical protein
MAPTTNQITRISIFYRIYFLYFEPIAALGGTYLCLFDPTRFLKGTMSLGAFTSFQPIELSPILTMLLTNIGSLYVLFAINEGLVLRATRERKVWYLILAAMLAADSGHLYAAWAIDPERVWQVIAWNSDEWVNYGTLVLGAALRVAFLLGVGRN